MDNKPTDTAKVVTWWLKDNSVNALVWPPQRSDLKSAEILACTGLGGT